MRLLKSYAAAICITFIHQSGQLVVYQLLNLINKQHKVCRPIKGVALMRDKGKNL
jgi:hypothetical protein